MFKHALLNEIVVFISVAEYRSFTLAAEALGSTKSGTGKAVRKLEAELGLKLFNRTTRSVRLTEEGRIFYQASKHAVDTLNEAKLILDARKEEPAGKLRVNLPIGIGKRVVKALYQFTVENPKVIVEIALTDRFEDAIKGEWDIVVRIGELSDSSFIAKKLCQSKRILCASKGYLEEKGYPTKVEELQQHGAVMFKMPNGKIRPWLLSSNGGELDEILPKTVAVCHDGRTLVDAIVSGLGIGQVYDKAIGIEDSNDIIELLPHLATQGPPINALIPSGRAMPAKTKVFIEFLKQQFE